VAAAGAERCTVKVEDAQAGGSYSLVEVTLDPGLPATLLHVHYDFAESYFVLDGEVSAEVGGDTARAGPGSVIQVAPSVPHLLNPAGRSGARYLCITPRSQQSQPEFLP
jgi:mannose-6-phosphate isomerase-like protein (cupin superfamily)